MSNPSLGAFLCRILVLGWLIANSQPPCTLIPSLWDVYKSTKKIRIKLFKCREFSLAIIPGEI